MKNLTPIAISFLFFISCVEAPPAKAQAEKFDFDLSTEWQLASHSETHDATIMEFVRKGDDINNWKELVTFQNFARKGALSPRGAMPSPEDYLNALKALREKECPGATEWNIIAQDENSLVYEWQLSKPCSGAPASAQAEQQSEIAKIMYGQYNIFILHYAAKVNELAPDMRTKWITEFSKFNITVGGQPLHFVSDTVDVIVPFAADKVTAALAPAMESVSCHVTKTASNRIECKRPRSGYGTKTASGGESVTAVLSPDGDNIHLRISTGRGFYGRLVKSDWSVPIYEAMMKALQQPQPHP